MARFHRIYVMLCISWLICTLNDDFKAQIFSHFMCLMTVYYILFSFFQKFNYYFLSYLLLLTNHFSCKTGTYNSCRCHSTIWRRTITLPTIIRLILVFLRVPTWNLNDVLKILSSVTDWMYCCPMRPWCPVIHTDLHQLQSSPLRWCCPQKNFTLMSLYLSIKVKCTRISVVTAYFINLSVLTLNGR